MAKSLEMAVIGINGDPTASHVCVSKYLTGPGLGSSIINQKEEEVDSACAQLIQARH